MKVLHAVLLSAAVLVVVLVFAHFAGGSSSTLDCGPEGKPALNGTACIDRHPVTYP